MNHHDQGTYSRPAKHVFTRRLLIALFLVITLTQRGVPSGTAASIPLSKIRIAFTQNNNVYLMNADGSGRVAVTTRGTSSEVVNRIWYPR